MVAISRQLHHNRRYILDVDHGRDIRKNNHSTNVDLICNDLIISTVFCDTTVRVIYQLSQKGDQSVLKKVCINCDGPNQKVWYNFFYLWYLLE